MKILKRIEEVKRKYRLRVILPQLHYWYGKPEGILRRYYAKLGLKEVDWHEIPQHKDNH